MEKVKEIPASPLDILLLPVSIHKKISTQLKGLIVAFLFVGAFDMFFYVNVIKEGYFTGSPAGILFKILLFTVLSLVLGAVDVICTMVPIAEFAMMIGKRSEKFVSSRFPIIMMKIYALSHILFIIPSVLSEYAGVKWELIDVSSPAYIRLLFSFLVIIAMFLPYAQFGIIFRALSVRTRIQAFGKIILLLAFYFWTQFSNGAIIFFETLFYRIMKSV